MFDIDGTLLDSAIDICGAVEQALAGTNCKPVSFEHLRSYIGLHLQALFGDLFPEYTQDQTDRLIQDYRTHYLARKHAQTTIHPGVPEALAQLGGRKSTATTKGTPTTRLILEQFGLLRYFDHVQGTDGIPCKPAPDVVLAALEALSARPQDCLFIGDSPADMEAGRRAGVQICAVRYGYGNPEELVRWKPDYWVSDLRELGNGTR